MMSFWCKQNGSIHFTKAMRFPNFMVKQLPEIEWSYIAKFVRKKLKMRTDDE